MLNKIDVNLRMPLLADCELIFNWSNLKDVRANSQNNKPIPYEQHKYWFHNIIKKKFHLVIFSANDKPCGMVRIKEVNKEVFISYMVDPEYRNLKISKKMLEMYLRLIFTELNITTVYAIVLNFNLKSINLLDSIGFKKINCDDKKTKLMIDLNEI